MQCVTAVFSDHTHVLVYIKSNCNEIAFILRCMSRLNSSINNGFPTLINWISLFLFKELLDGCWMVFVFFIQILIDHSGSEQWRF